MPRYWRTLTEGINLHRPSLTLPLFLTLKSWSFCGFLIAPHCWMLHRNNLKCTVLMQFGHVSLSSGAGLPHRECIYVRKSRIFIYRYFFFGKFTSCKASSYPTNTWAFLWHSNKHWLVIDNTADSRTLSKKLAIRSLWLMAAAKSP